MRKEMIGINEWFFSENSATELFYWIQVILVENLPKFSGKFTQI